MHGEGSAVMQKRVRRNSMAEGGQHQHQAQGSAHMLPPIFSGPQKKQNQKTRQLAPLPHRGPQIRSQLSESSPIRYSSAVNNGAMQSERHQNDGITSSAMKQTSTSVPNNSCKAIEQNLSPAALPTQEDEIQEEGKRQPKVNFVKKNEERLREMQEQRAKELKDIEDQRAKLLRRQEKLK